MPGTFSAVVAGSKGFVDAVQGHLKLRFGALPRVARDPAEALRACADRRGLLVLEYAGSPWLEAVKSLRGAGGEASLSIVAAVPLEQASDVQPLQRAGVDEVVSWQGRVDPVIWAVDRIVDRQRAQQDEAAPPAPEAPSEDEVETGFELRELPDGEAAASSAAVPVLSTAPRAAPIPLAPLPAVPWPDAVPPAAAAEALLLSVFAGETAGETELAAAERVLAAASELESAALSGGEVAVEAEALRAATAMRLRLDLALSSVPAAGDAVNHPAAQQLLAEVDGVLERIKALAAAAPAGVAPSLEPIRLAIVDGGVKLAGALSQLVPEGPVAATEVAAQKPATRLLSIEKSESAPTMPRGRLALFVALAVAVAAAAAFHADRYIHPPRPSGPEHLSGSPEGSLATAGPGRTVFITSPTGRFAAEDVEKFKAQEELKGNAVRQVAPGALVLTRGASADGGVKGGSP